MCSQQRTPARYSPPSLRSPWLESKKSRRRHESLRGGAMDRGEHLEDVLWREHPDNRYFYFKQTYYKRPTRVRDLHV